ncbi:MAG: hypothetical protein KI790_07265 [Cyclobacteriaceae bacterium]|nr:hypothetical protein [Cyclobacteriaceae bacterium HetDA_MAG_MS6]
MSKSRYSGGIRYVMLIFSWSIVGFASAQKIKTVSLTLQTESVSIPFTRIGEIHPGLEIGFNLSEKVKANSTRRWNGYIGWFYHRDFDQSVYLRGEYEFSYPLKNTIAFHLPIGLGYMHSFHTRPVYEQNDDGSFSEKRQWGRPHALFNIGLGMSYLKLGAVTPFIKYETFAQSPFVATIPVAPRNFFKIGTSIKIN